MTDPREITAEELEAFSDEYLSQLLNRKPIGKTVAMDLVVRAAHTLRKREERIRELERQLDRIKEFERIRWDNAFKRLIREEGGGE